MPFVVKAQTWQLNNLKYGHRFKGLRADSIFIIPKSLPPGVSWIDTGAIRYNISDSSIYVHSGSQWRQVGSGSTYTFTNGLTNTSGTVRLGGNLTQTTVINGQSLYPFTFDNLTAYNVNLADGAEFNQYAFSSVNGTTSNLQQTHRKVDIDFGSADGMFANYLFDKEMMELKVTKGGLISEFRMNGDSLYTQLNSTTKRWAFRNPGRAATDTSVNKPWTWNTSTQRMEVLDGWPVSSGGAGGGGSSVTNFSLDSTGENFLGTIYDSTTWNNLSSFTNNGGTFTVTANKIVGSAGSGTFTQSLDLNRFTLLERWKICAKVKVSSGVYGFGLGIRSAEAGSKVDALGRFSGIDGTLILNLGASHAASGTSSAITFSTNDFIILTVERNKDVITVSGRNATTNSATVSVSYTYLTSDGTILLPNTGKFAIYSFGGAFTVDSLAITSKEVKRAMVMTIGDSKTQAYYASTWANRYSEKLGVKFSSTVVSAGGYDQTADVINRLPEIYALAPKQIILAIGSNDIRQGVPAATIYANYDTIVARLERNIPGCVVYHNEPFYESGGLDQTGLRAHILATYPASKIFYTYDILRQPNTLNADLVHPNDLGNSYIFNAIVEKMVLVGGDNLAASGSSTNLAASSIPFSDGSVLVEDNANLRFNAVSTLFGVGGTPTARAHIFTTNDAAPSTLTSFTNKHVVIGPSGNGLALSYSTTNNRAYLSAVSPGLAWRSFGFQGNDINFYYQGSSTPTWSVDGNGAHSNIGSINNGLRNTFINTNTGINAFSEVAIGQSATATDQLRIITLSSGYNTVQNYVQDGATIEAGSTLSGGLSIASTHASGVMRFYTGGTTERARFDANGRLGINTTAVNSTMHVNGSFATAYTSTATSLTLDVSHNTVNVTATGQTITLPTSVGISGREYVLINSSSGNITVATTSSQLIGNFTTATTYTLASDKSVTLISDGSNWKIKTSN